MLNDLPFRTISSIRGKWGRYAFLFSYSDRYAYSGHSAVTGKRTNSWQDTEPVLRHFGKQNYSARKRYRALCCGFGEILSDADLQK